MNSKGHIVPVSHWPHCGDCTWAIVQWLSLCEFYLTPSVSKGYYTLKLKLLWSLKWDSICFCTHSGSTQLAGRDRDMVVSPPQLFPQWPILSTITVTSPSRGAQRGWGYCRLSFLNAQSGPATILK